uniref:Putative Phage integrase n=1 Tax=mine drainage metagenome TaxID=410659 RepID=E6PHS9_9ZZZZ
MADGERLPLLVASNGLPVPLPNQWALFMRRPQLQSNSLTEELRAIAYLYDWATRRKVDLDERLETGNGLAPDELAVLYQNLRYVRPFGRDAAARRLADVDGMRVVTGQVHATRVGFVRAYLTWTLERLLYRLDISDARVPRIRERCEHVSRIAREYQRGASDSGAPRVGLSPEQRSRFLRIIDPGSPSNPFSRTTRFRNYVMILLMLTFGFRRGEVLKLYVGDVNVKGRQPSLRVVRRPGDENDFRGLEPAVKTLGREVWLYPEIARVLDSFIQRHRPLYPGVDRSPFLFFSKDGNPLSLRMVNAVLEQVCRHFPTFSGVLSPHVLRHTYNDMLVENARKLGVDGEAFKQAQNYLNGWNLDSEQGALYSRRAIEGHARDISLAHQRSLFNG